MEEKSDPLAKFTMKIIKTIISDTSLRWSATAAVLRKGSMRTRKKTASMNLSDRKLTMLHFIQCILKVSRPKFSKKSRKIEWKRGLRRINYA